MSNITINSMICANGETVEWTLRSGHVRLVELYTSEKLSEEEAFKRLINMLVGTPIGNRLYR